MRENPAMSSVRPLRTVSLAAALLGCLLSCSACNRTPPEPAPAASTISPEPATARPPPSVALLSSTSTTARCITPLASVAPPVPPKATPPACPQDPGPLKLGTAEVSFPETNNLKITVELARTPPEIERGLMYRQSMGDDRGMLFKMEARKEQTFWMSNTCISLDMLFVDDDGTIVGVSEAATPLSEDIRKVGCPSSFVLEVNGGWVRKHGVRPGQKITLPRL
jgi:uncharacterized protein